MREMNPHPKKMDSNPPSPGALIEDISEGYKADGERTAGNQRIDIRENFCNRLSEGGGDNNSKSGCTIYKAGPVLALLTKLASSSSLGRILLPPTSLTPPRKMSLALLLLLDNHLPSLLAGYQYAKGYSLTSRLQHR
jgi:hypothetical protein